jgi:hypothetical protein
MWFPRTKKLWHHTLSRARPWLLLPAPPPLLLLLLCLILEHATAPLAHKELLKEADINRTNQTDRV